MNIDEYKDHGRQRYKALCQVVRQLLQQEIAADSAYRLQQVQHRAKSVDSLRKRLAETDQLDSQKIETLRKDLGGCRVIFYTNNDVNRFAQSGILSDLFDIDWERSKFHQPGPGEQNTASLFQSFNYVVSLKKERTDLVEYRDFTGLYCEVQVQTSLNHAWAEMAHDTIYKRGDLEGFGAREMETIERRLDEAMRAHLLPAGYLFQRIATDVQRIAEGKALFDDGVIDAVVDAADNNDRDEAVRRLKDDVLPHYDEVAIVFPEIREKLAKAWLLADQTDSVPHETPFGGYEGTSSDAVTAKIADILGRYRNLDLEATYQLLKELYPQTRSDESRAQLVKLAKEFASNVMQVWDKYGPHVQTELADFLSKEDDITPFAPVAIEMAEQILGSEVQGTTSSASSVTFHTGAIVYSDALAEARRRSIDTLTRYAETVTQDDGMVRLALSALLYAAQTPRRGVPSIEVERMIFSDFAYALDNIAAFIGKCSKTVRQDFESRLLQQWRWKKKLRDDQANDPAMNSAHADLTRIILEIRDKLNADDEFLAFKTMVGFKSVFAPMWDEDYTRHNRQTALREELQRNLVESVTEENWAVWRGRIVEAANVKSNDLATFPPFSRFLSLIAEKHPFLVLELLVDRTGLPDWTVDTIARVLLQSEAAHQTRETLASWIKEQKYLDQISACIALAAGAESELIEQAAAKAVETRSPRACQLFVDGAIHRFNENPELWRDKVFFPCLAALKEMGRYDWANQIWNNAEGASLLSSLTEAQAAQVLDAMVGIDEINYEAEQILAPILDASPQLVVDWFKDRISRSETVDDIAYDATPYSFYDLHKPLQEHGHLLIEMLRGLHGNDDQHVRWNASHFLSRVFPSFEPQLSDNLSEMVESADTEDLEFIVSILAGYDGNSALFPLLRNIVASENCTQAIENGVSVLINETGVMSGEFGAAETYKAKIELLKPWLEDKSQRVVTFATNETRMLKRGVAADLRSAQERIAMRKLEYGEPLSGGEPDNNLGSESD